MLTFDPFFVRAAAMPNDPFLFEQWYLQAIHAPTDVEQTPGSPDVIVAVLDAGFDLDHPDLTGQYWRNLKEIPDNNKDDDGNGYEDDVQGWDFVDSDPIPVPQIDEIFNDTIISHGTVIAGIIGATANNKEGIVGVSRGVKIMPLRILNSKGAGSTSDVRQAIVYAVQNGAQVINLSFTSDKPDERLKQTIEWAVDQGAVIVSAVGNDDRDIDKKPTFPACYDLLSGRDLVLGVTATDRENRKATFSNFGASCTDVSAPGTNIFGTVYHDSSNLLTSTAYSSPWEGTSIAVPMVSATAAILKTLFPLLTPEQVYLSIKLSVSPVGESSLDARKQLGAGLLNVSGALEAAKVFAREGGVPRSRIIAHSKSFFVAEGQGHEPIVKRFNAQGDRLASFLAYNKNFRGGISLAVGDVNGDGTEEIVTGARRGGGPQVRIFDLNGNVLFQFFADDPSDRDGILIGTADTNGDGVAEIFVTPERGGTGEIKVFNQFGQLQGLLRPFGREGGLIRMAFGNMDEDPENEIITTWSLNAHPVVRILDGNGRYVREFYVPEPLAQGAVEAGDIDGDGIDEILLAAPPGKFSFIEVYSPLGKQKGLFSVYGPLMRAGVQPCVGDIDQNGRSEIYTTPMTGAGPHVQMYDSDGLLIGGFFAFDKLNRSGAVCAIWNP